MHALAVSALLNHTASQVNIALLSVFDWVVFLRQCGGYGVRLRFI